MMNNSRNSSQRTAVLNRQSAEGLPTGDASTNVLNLLNGETAAFITGFCAALSYLVGHVVLVRSQKEVARVDARSIVAMVQYLKSVWDWPVVYLPRNTMRAHSLSIKVYTAVTVSERTRDPYPARPQLGSDYRPVFINLVPKSAFKAAASTLARTRIAAISTAALFDCAWPTSKRCAAIQAHAVYKYSEIAVAVNILVSHELNLLKQWFSLRSGSPGNVHSLAGRFVF